MYIYRLIYISLRGDLGVRNRSCPSKSCKKYSEIIKMEEELLLMLVAGIMGLVMYRTQIVKDEGTPVKSVRFEDKPVIKEPEKLDVPEKVDVPEKLDPIIEEYFSDSD